MTSDQAEVCTLSGWVSPPPGGPIRSITERPSLPPGCPLGPFTRCPISVPCGSPSQGESNGLTTSARVPAWVRSLLYTGGAPSATDDASPPVPGPSPFGPGVSALWAVQHLPPVLTLDAYRGSLTLTIPRHPGRLNRLVLTVTASAHASAAVLADVAALSPGLRTPPLPATHAWVGYGWQNNRLYPFLKVQQLHEQPRVARSAGLAPHPGSSTLTVVPCPGAEQTSARPPSRCARS